MFAFHNANSTLAATNAPAPYRGNPPAESQNPTKLAWEVVAMPCLFVRQHVWKARREGGGGAIVTFHLGRGVAFVTFPRLPLFPFPPRATLFSWRKEADNNCHLEDCRKDAKMRGNLPELKSWRKRAATAEPSQSSQRRPRNGRTRRQVW